MEHVGGMATYWISEPNINVRIEDQPLAYSAALGDPVIFSLSYRQRGNVPAYPNIFGVGTNWSCSFRAYLVSLTNDVLTPTLMRLHRGSAGWVSAAPLLTTTFSA